MRFKAKNKDAANPRFTLKPVSGSRQKFSIPMFWGYDSIFK
jgi:hypothetical protein